MDITYKEYMRQAIETNNKHADSAAGSIAGPAYVSLDRIPKNPDGTFTTLAIRFLEDLLFCHLRAAVLNPRLFERCLTYNPFFWSDISFTPQNRFSTFSQKAPMADAHTLSEYRDRLNETGMWREMVEQRGVPKYMLSPFI